MFKDGKELARSGGADVVLATSNSNSAMSDALEALRPDGRLIVMGVDAADNFSFTPAALLVKRARVIMSSQNNRRDLFEALAWVAEKKLRVVTETFSLDEIAKAYDKVANGKVRFRAVILPNA